jgi:uncharacterized membrane protein SpoIIM required for sporulation
MTTLIPALIIICTIGLLALSGCIMWLIIRGGSDGPDT